MNMVTERKALKFVVTGDFGLRGFLRQAALLRKRVEVLHTDFSSKGKSRKLQDAATFDVETDKNAAELRALLAQVRGVQQATVMEASHA